MGGASLYIEVQSVRHKSAGGGTLATTGQMGSVMEESTRIAHTFARRKLEEYQVCSFVCFVCLFGVCGLSLFGKGGGRWRRSVVSPLSVKPVCPAPATAPN